MIAATAIVTGRVQGVGFRQFVKTLADRLELSGTVRNVDDGSVEIFVQVGAEGEADEFFERVAKGPGFVAEITQASATPDPTITDFRIVR